MVDLCLSTVSSLHIWITVSSLANKDPANGKSILFRQIELNWINAPLDDPHDFIGLYLDSQPDELQAQPVSVHKLNGRMNGRLTTDYYLPMINFMNETKLLARQATSDEREIQYDIDTSAPFGPSERQNNNWHPYNAYGALAHNHQRRKKSISRTSLIDECIGYCIAYHSQSRILATNCLKTNPNWMQETQSTSRSLPSLMIPGTHNSATYPRQLDKTVLQIISKYQINQEESIFNQLVYGIRYLDLRVGHSRVKQRPEEFWIYHDIFRTDVSVEEVFEQVARFLELTSHEIIVMDFHRFTVGFQNENIQTQRERHAKLLDLLFKQLGQYIIPSYLGQHAPLNEYIAMGKRLVVGYANRAQLLGVQADNHSGMFALYSAQASQRNQQVRDIDADEVSSKRINQSCPYPVPGSPGPRRTKNLTITRLRAQQNLDTNLSDQGQQADMQSDRRMGTLIYNKLKSLKLISRQFSKRSIENKEKGDTMGDNKHRKLASNDSGSASARARQRAAGASTTSTTSTTTTTTTTREPVSAQLVLGDESAGSLEEAILNLPSRLGILFPPVRHLWPNRDTVEGLAQYMNETTCRKYFGELRSMMVELTPTVFGAISDKYDGNRRLADLANRPVTDWIRQRWLHCMNIVASDFFLGNDLIRLSIYANRMRLSNNHRHVDDLSSFGGQCKSFRRVEQLLDKSRITAGLHYHQQPQPAGTNSQSANPDGISELYSFFKRIFNL